MSNYMKYSGRPFLLVNVIKRPAQGVHTNRKDYINVTGNTDTFEQTEIVDRLKPKHLQTAFVIIDIMRSEVVSHKFKGDENHVVNLEGMCEHYLSKYMEVCKKGLDIYLSKRAREMLTATAVERAKILSEVSDASDVPSEVTALQGSKEAQRRLRQLAKRNAKS